jgi:RNA polymerase sigma-70 factor (ECF subfamily)
MKKARTDRCSELYRAYGPTIYARCRHMLRDASAAEDAAQETFIRVHRHLASAPDGPSALRWIYRIATNVCLNEMRNSRRRPALVGDISAFTASDTSSERGIVRSDLERTLVRVPAHLCAAAWLYHVDGFDQSEVAACLGISRRTVCNYLTDFAARARNVVARGDAVTTRPRDVANAQPAHRVRFRLVAFG